MIKEIIKQLEENVLNPSINEGKDVKLVHECIKYVRRYLSIEEEENKKIYNQGYYDGSTTMCRDMIEYDNWIPVKKKPLVSGTYLVTYHNSMSNTRAVHTRDFNAKTGEWREYGTMRRVVAWRELPEEYTLDLDDEE